MSTLRRTCALLALLLVLASLSSASAFDGRPRLVVVVVVDQLRADLLEHYRPQFVEGGFRLLLDRGAYFADCHYDYVNLRTSASHATLFTGAYSDGHGIIGNRWWDPGLKKFVTATYDPSTRLVGGRKDSEGASPRYLRATTLGDQLKLATGGKGRVYSVSLKSTAAVLSAGRGADAAFWLQPTGEWVTSSFYRAELPAWAQQFNTDQRAGKYLGQEWKDANGKVLARVTRENFRATPAGIAYQLEFVRELILREKLGGGPNTDLLVIPISSLDYLGHDTGLESPIAGALVVDMDRQLAGFFSFLGEHLGLANVWIALSADHGLSPVPELTAQLRLGSKASLDLDAIRAHLNQELSARLTRGKTTQFVVGVDWPIFYLAQEAFPASTSADPEREAETAVGELLLKNGFQNYVTRAQLARGPWPPTVRWRRYAHSFSPLPGWFVIAEPPPFAIGVPPADHGTGYGYDTHVPLAFFGVPFVPGKYYGRAEPVDLAATLASLLGINPPSHSVGRVLAEALQEPEVPKR